ncbi:AAA domain-containing protein [Spirosoma arcticum]
MIVQKTVLSAFRRRLTNLGSRNRSLLLTSLPASQFLDLHETNFLLNKPSFNLIANLIGRKTSVPVCEVLDARQERSNEVSRKVRRIDRTARFIKEESGTDDLYVGWPFVRGKFMDGTVVHGPLLFFPVQLSQEGRFWKLTRRSNELAFLNSTFALAYGQFNQLKLPDDLIEKTVDDFDKDPLVFRTQLYEWLKETPVEINFNPDLFTDQLQFFDKQTAKSLDQLERAGELKLYSEAVLGIFPQAGSFLVPDYDALIGREGSEKEEMEMPFAGVDWELANKPNDFSISERFIRTPLPLDAAQEAAVRAVKSGQSIVVQGPPGTGKSQLIANLMADSAASGKRVLLVCQKRAALDVVHERLRQVGMAPFMALIHDFQDDRRTLYAQLAEQIEQVDTYRQQNNGLNAVLLERDFEQESRRIDEAITSLNVFKDALFDTAECGLSVKELYLTSSPQKPTVELGDVYLQFPFSVADDFVRRLADYAGYRRRIGTTHPWDDRVNFAHFTAQDTAKAEQVLVRWSQTADLTKEQLRMLLDRPLSRAELTDWLAHDGELTALLALLNTPDATALWAISQVLRTNPAHPAQKIGESALEVLIADWEETLALPGPECSLQPIDRPAFQILLFSALTARSSWVRWRWWQLTDPGKVQLQRVALANGLTLSTVDLQTLKIKIDKRLQLATIDHQTELLLTGLPVPNTPDGLRLVGRARQLIDRINTIQPLHILPAWVWTTHQQFTNVVTSVLTIATTIVAEQRIGKSYLTDNQLNLVWQNGEYAQTLRTALRQDFDLLIGADQLKAGFSDAERTVIGRLADMASSRWVATFQNALCLTWIDHIEQKHPQLRSVSSLRMDQIEQDLQESVGRKQALSRAILLVKLREQTYRNLTFNRLSNVITYRDLLHQTTKKRNVWPVRKLMESFDSEVFRVLPCWLASPESVSAMFPLRDDLFDLVIFDEASQCFAEQGIPAMARGKQVVVTGDNQQLRPSDLYRTRIDEPEPDDETPVAMEVESLLELAVQQLPQVSLTEHYRSRSLDLIAFSNQHFYQNKLLLLPPFSDANGHEPAIRYLHVNGTWQQNKNPVEAEAVLQLLSQVAVDLPGRSVGIVTFNYPQQQLIQDLLDDRRSVPSPTHRTAPTPLPEGERNISPNPDSLTPSLSGRGVGAVRRVGEGIFVKNIENVQGDERDVIIFSVGYAPDEHGRLTMQFGSLSMHGGENRLNVAVTRARERVYLITSLWPDQLIVDETANKGPRLLRAYLNYALNVSQGHFRPTPQPNVLLPTTSLLKNLLAAQHPDWLPELPFADLTEKNGDTYQSLILTDDDAYYQQTPKQAHAYLPIALQTRKWPFQRVWSREFWRKWMD